MFTKTQAFNLKISDLVERYGVSPQSLRNWEAQGILPRSHRTPGGHRRYGAAHVEALNRLFGIIGEAARIDPVKH